MIEFIHPAAAVLPGAGSDYRAVQDNDATHRKFFPAEGLPGLLEGQAHEPLMPTSLLFHPDSPEIVSDTAT
jgi:hypothetical protein